MRAAYENVWADRTLRNLKGVGRTKVNTIVGAIGFDWFSREHKMHYSGPGDPWWGTDVAEFSLGKGHCIVSQLRLIENLGGDPVADRIMKNLISYADKL